jgi:luciferase family oxidoreductase group 1
MPGIASAAAVVIAHVAAGTKTIRVGAGGIMLPNHSPLVIAEQFGTLEALQGRIDLGLGRAPGSDQTTARALRRNLQSDADAFPQDVLELMDYMSDSRASACWPCPARARKCRCGYSGPACSAPSWRPTGLPLRLPRTSRRR